MWRERLEARIAPGWTALAVMPSAAQRRGPRPRRGRWRSWTGRRRSTGRRRGARSGGRRRSTGDAQVADRAERDDRAPAAAASASWRPRASAKWPRWLVANCSSQPSGGAAGRQRHHAGVVDQDVQRAVPGGGERGDGGQVGEVEAADARRRAVDRMSAATRSPAAVSRTASVTSAPAPASARAVSTPMPDEPPVTIARLPVRSMPAMTSAAVESKPNGVVIRVCWHGCS